MKILLLIPSEPRRSKEAIQEKVTEHLGIGYISSALKQDNHNVDIINLGFSNYSINSLTNIIQTKGYSLIGITIAYQKILASAVELVNELRNSNINQPVVLGGHPVAFWYNELLQKKNRIDYLCIGEGEKTIVELAIAIENNLPVDGIKGIAFRGKNDEVILNNYRNSITQLDQVSFPDRIHVEEMLKENYREQYINIAGSRGCTWSCCSFCDIQEFYKKCPGEKWRGRSISNILDEIEILILKYRYDKFNFVDDDFFGPEETKHKRIEEFCSEIERRKLQFNFRITCKVKDIQEDIIRKLKNVGLERVFIGSESGVQRTLRTFGKGISVEENGQAIQTIKSLNLKCECGSIFIDPYTTVEEIMSNIEFWESFGLMSIELFNKLDVYRGTSIYKKLLKDNMLDELNFDYDYSKYMDKKTAKVLDIVNIIRSQYITTNFRKIKSLRRQVLSLAQDGQVNQRNLRSVVNEMKEVKTLLNSVVFTESLKEIIHNIDAVLIGDFNIKEYLDAKYQVFDSKHQLIREKLITNS